MQTKISPFLVGIQPVCRRLVAELSYEYSYVSILATDVAGKSYAVRRGGIDVNDYMLNERGFVVRVFNGTLYSEVSFNEFSEDKYTEKLVEIRQELAKQFAAMKKYALPLGQLPKVEEEETVENFQNEVEIDPESMSADQKLDRLSAMMNKGLSLSTNLVDFRVMYTEVLVSKLFISLKKELIQGYRWSQGALVTIGRKDGKTRFTFQGHSGMKGLELFDEMEAGIEEVVATMEQLFDAKAVEPGEYDVICTPEVTGLIAHEAFGHGVEMDMFVKNRAKAKEYMNQPVASKHVTMMDGAKGVNEVSSYLFDDEGTLGTTITVIEEGILKAGFSDLLSALRLNTKPSGNGKRQSFERKAYARMTNTYFQPGSDKLKDMIASIKHGYLLEGMESGMEDPKHWGIQCMLSRGREIKDGKFTGQLIAPVILTGYVPDLLSSISMVSDDFELYGSGFCGKGYKEYVKASDGGPYIKAKARLG